MRHTIASHPVEGEIRAVLNQGNHHKVLLPRREGSNIRIKTQYGCGGEDQ